MAQAARGRAMPAALDDLATACLAAAGNGERP
jgi:hypothetical protein